MPIALFSSLGRLSESNMQSISTQLEQLYHENSRNGNYWCDSGVWIWMCVCVCCMCVVCVVCVCCVCVVLCVCVVCVCVVCCVCCTVCVCVCVCYVCLCVLCAYLCSDLTCFFTDMNTVVTEVLLKACVTPAMLSDRFMLEHCMLLTLLHCHMGSEVGKWVCLPRLHTYTCADMHAHGCMNATDCSMLTYTQTTHIYIMCLQFTHMTLMYNQPTCV